MFSSYFSWDNNKQRYQSCVLGNRHHTLKYQFWCRHQIPKDPFWRKLSNLLPPPPPPTTPTLQSAQMPFCTALYFVQLSIFKNDPCRSSTDRFPSTDGHIWCLLVSCTRTSSLESCPAPSSPDWEPTVPCADRLNSPALSLATPVEPSSISWLHCCLWNTWVAPTKTASTTLITAQ